MRQGTVPWWSDEKGYGRITGDDGYVYDASSSPGSRERQITAEPAR